VKISCWNKRASIINCWSQSLFFFLQKSKSLCRGKCDANAWLAYVIPASLY